jgi:hypothetical protein
MGKRIQIERRTFGRYHVLKYIGYDYEKKGAFYKCIDMPTGRYHTIRADHLKPIQLNYEQTLRDISAIEAYKKKNGIK